MSTRAATLRAIQGGVRLVMALSMTGGEGYMGVRDDVPSAYHELERGAPFCANPVCALNVRLHDAQVTGGGNWVSLPDGRTFGRGRYGAALLCDACGTRRGPVRLSERAPRRLRLRLLAGANE